MLLSSGTYANLIAANSHFAELIRKFQEEQKEEEDEDDNEDESDDTQVEGADTVDELKEHTDDETHPSLFDESHNSAAHPATHRQRSRVSEISSGSGEGGVEGGGLRKRTTSRQRSKSVAHEKGRDVAKAEEKRDLSKAKLTDDEEAAVGNRLLL